MNKTKNKFTKKDSSKQSQWKKFMIGALAVICFIYCGNQFNFTIIHFEYIIWLFIISGAISAILLYRSEKNNIGSIYDILLFLIIKIFIYGSLFTSLFYLTNKYLSAGKEYSKTVAIILIGQEKTIKGLTNNYALVEIEGLEKQINIHKNTLEELIISNHIKFHLKTGFWRFTIITESKLEE